jgi:biotin carboxyl carrier protein
MAPRIVGRLAAEITGTLSYWLVEDGAAVQEGEHVADVECMKVFFPVYAPAAGVLRYAAKLGEVLAQDQVLALVEEA